MFAQAREAAGTGRADFDGPTVGDVLDQATNTYGKPFSDVLAICNVWLNGEPTDRTQSVASTDEVAVLPPVSGG